jgi:hypothetical protein
VIAHEDLETERWDVNQALLQADIGRVTFTEQAEGFVVPGKEGWVIRLNKSLHIWPTASTSTMESLSR